MQHEIHAGLLIDLQNNVLLLRNAEPGQLRLHGVHRWPQAGKKVLPLVVALRRLRDIRTVIGDRDGCIHHDGPALVRHLSANLGLVRSLPKHCRPGQQHGHEWENERGDGTQTATADTHGRPPQWNFHIITSQHYYFRLSRKSRQIATGIWFPSESRKFKNFRLMRAPELAPAACPRFRRAHLAFLFLELAGSVSRLPNINLCCDSFLLVSSNYVS